MKRAVLFILLALCNDTVLAENVTQASLVAILANPSGHDGKLLVVSGYVCRAQSDQYGLFLTRSDCEDANYANAIEIDLSGLRKKLPTAPTLLTVEGRFQDRSRRAFVDESFVWGMIRASNVSGRSIR